LKSRPLAGKKVLITRAAATSDDFVAHLRAAGAEPLAAPAIAIEPPDDESAAELAVRIVATYAWIVFTSQNGAAAFFDRLYARGADARAVGDTRVAAIGPKTAERLLAYGVRADFVPARYVAEEVADGLLERTVSGERIALYVAQDARDVLAEKLRAEERIVDVYPAYKTVPVLDERIARLAREADIWTFASASSVHALVANLPDAARLSQEKIVACIGPVTADAARAVGFAVSSIADSATLEGLVEALSQAATAPA